MSASLFYALENPGSFRSGRRCAGAQGTMERGRLALDEGGTPSFPGLFHAREGFQPSKYDSLTPNSPVS